TSTSTSTSVALGAELAPSKCVGERPNCLGAMADGVFHFRRQFAESLLGSVRNENWVVAKSGVAAYFVSDFSLHDPLEDSEEIAIARERHDAAKSGTASICFCANSRKLAEYFIDFVNISRVRAPVTRRINSGCTVEGVNLQS